MDEENKNKPKDKLNDQRTAEPRNQDYENYVDELSEESFPASDSPSFTPGSHMGKPPKRPSRESSSDSHKSKS